MDWSIITQYGVLGICVAALAWYVLHLDKQHREEIKQLREEHKQEVKELTKAFDRLNSTVQRLIDTIKGV